MDHLKDAHYFRLPSQGNIYTMVDLKVVNGPHKLLVASLKRDIFCLEYQDSSLGNLVPTSKEILFTYIPSGAEIISMDAFNKSSTKNEFVIGITINKNSTNLDPLETYLNIYSEWEENDDFNIENIAQNCLNVKLNFIPYMLTHTNLILWDENKILSKEIVFLLSGSDNQIHIFREHVDHLYKEIETREYFPEFNKTPSPIVWIDFYYLNDYTQRFSVFACECGYVKLLKICTKTKTIQFNFSTKFNNYISHISIYPQFNDPPILSDEILKVVKYNKKPLKLNVVVINTILPPVVFEDVLKYGFSNYFCLQRHDNACILSCSQVIDIDFDGEKEIVIGSSAQVLNNFNKIFNHHSKLLIYKKKSESGWGLEGIKQFSSPVISLKYVDIIEDGVKELVVLSMKGLHFLQHDFSYINKMLTEKINNLSIENVPIPNISP